MLARAFSALLVLAACVSCWMGFKAGTYIAEQASRASGKTAAQLVNVPTAEVLRLAGYSPSSR